MLSCCLRRFKQPSKRYVTLDDVNSACAIPPESLIQFTGNGNDNEKKVRIRSPTPSWSVKVIREPSIVTKDCMSKYTINNKSFTLTCNNFNYFCYLKPDYIQSITEEGEWIVKIQLNRYAIRHCDERYILIDFISKKITWCNVSSCAPSTKAAVLDDTMLKLDVCT
jgi:hypothetical protein